MKMPSAGLEEHGARLINHGSEGFTIQLPSGEALGVLPHSPDEAAFVSDDPKRAYELRPSWAFQGAVRALVELDAKALVVQRDSDLSETGRAKKLHPLYDRAIEAYGFVSNDLSEYATTVQAKEEARYAVPAVGTNDVVSMMRDTEIRNAIRGMSDDERRGLFETLNEGENPQLLTAVLRSPFSLGAMEVLARAGWKSAIDKADPKGIAAINLEKASIDWGWKTMAGVRHRLISKMELPRDVLFAKAQNRGLAKHFGFSPAEAYQLERKLKYAAA